MKVYLSIGGNLGDRLQNIKDAISEISDKIAIPDEVSSIYLSEPWGFEHAKYFTNAVIKLETDINPKGILSIILDIEANLKRTRTNSGYQGRTMDIDILYYGDLCIKTTELEVPHPRINNRPFVLLPIKDIEPDFIDPISKTNINQMIKSCTDKGKIKKIAWVM